MTKPLLLLVNGAPAAGKTGFARRLSREMGLPLFSRDDIKEALFDSLGWSDRAWSAKLGAATWELLYRLVGQMLEAGQSLIVESNFQPQFANARLAQIETRYGCRIVQILCETDGETLLTRFRQRVESGERHPGHVDQLQYEAMRVFVEVEGRWEPLAVGELVTVDTTDFASIDFTALARRFLDASESKEDGTEMQKR